MDYINVFGLHLVEIKIALSDFVLALACFWCWQNIKQHTLNLSDIVYIKSWRKFFLFLAISFLLGGFAHAFALYIESIIHLSAWYFSLLGLFFFQWGIVHLSFGSTKKRGVFMLCSLFLSAALSAVLSSFLVIVIYAFVSFFFVLRINSFKKIFSFKNTYSRLALFGAGLFIIAGIGFLIDLRLFFLDASTLSHIIITVGIILFGKGCLSVIKSMTQLNDQTEKDSLTQ